MNPVDSRTTVRWTSASPLRHADFQSDNGGSRGPTPTKAQSRHTQSELDTFLAQRRLWLDRNDPSVFPDVDHSTIISLNMTPAIKIIENDAGIAQVNVASPMLFMAKAP